MKQFLILISVVIASVSGNAQDFYLSYEKFCKTIEEGSLSAFGKTVSMQDDGENFEAVLIDSTGRMLMLKLSGKDVFEAFEKSGEKYLFNGFDAVYFGNEIMSVLLLYLPDLDATLTLNSNFSIEKTVLDQLAHDSGITLLKPEEIAWPEMIPLSHRLEGRILRIHTKPSTTEGYRFEVVVEMRCDETLISSLEHLRSEFYDRKEFIGMDQMLLISKGENIGKISDCDSTSTKLIFGYYIK
jgi:hypothetical protein